VYPLKSYSLTTSSGSLLTLLPGSSSIECSVTFHPGTSSLQSTRGRGQHLTENVRRQKREEEVFAREKLLRRFIAKKLFR